MYKIYFVFREGMYEREGENPLHISNTYMKNRYSTLEEQ